MLQKLTLLLVLALCFQSVAQNAASPSNQKSSGKTCEASQEAPGKTQESSRENGITVGHAKIFDNRTLTLMLESLSDTLHGLQVVDQDPLKKALGLLQGSQTQDVSRSFSILAGGT